MEINDITVASTTDTQEDVDSALGIEVKPAPVSGQPVAGEAAKAEEAVVAAPSKTEAVSETVKKEEGEAGEDIDDKSLPPKVQKRIDRLTRRNYDLASAKKELETRVEKLEKLADEGKGTAAKAQPAAAASTDDPEPNEDDYAKNGKEYKEFVKDLSAWQFRQEQKAAAAKDAERKENERLTKVIGEYNQQVEVARGKYDDFDEVLKQPDVQVPTSAQIAIVELDNGAEVAYYLGKNIDVCHKLMEMSDTRVVAEIGKIAARLEAKAAPAAIPGASPSKSKPASAAPAPIAPVAGSSAASEVDIDELPYQEYKKAREQGRS